MGTTVTTTETVMRDDSILSMPGWFVELCFAAGLSVLESVCVWLRYHGWQYHEIARMIGRRERAARDAAARGRARLAKLPAIPIGGTASLGELQGRLYREAHDILAAMRNQVAVRGGTRGGEEHLSRPRLVTVDDLVDERLRRLLGREGLDSTSGDV